MRNDGVTDALNSLLHSDPDVADREQIGAMIRHANQIRGWVDAANVRFTRRLHELASEGASESAGTVLTDEGRRSGREAKATENRERVCNEYPAMEDALAVGDVSSDHLDVLARLTKNLSDVERSDLHAVADDLLTSASTDYVSEFERKTRNMIDEIRTNHAPHDEAAELDRQRAASNIKHWVDKASGMHKTLIELDPVRDATLHAAIEAQLARLKQQAQAGDIPFAQLQVEALVAAVSPDAPGERRIPEIIALIDPRSACHGRHADTICETSNGVRLPVSTVQRMCCDAVVIGVTIGDNGEALDVGRELRTANRAQRRALRAMYRACAHRHCTVGFDRCRIHHVVRWIDGGTTDLANLIPLCEQHHHLVHEGGWQLTMTPDRVCTWTRPDGSIWFRGSSINRTNRNEKPGKQKPADEKPPDRQPVGATALEYRQPSLSSPPPASSAIQRPRTTATRYGAASS